MKMGGRGYPQAGPGYPSPEARSEITVINVRGEPIYDDAIRLGEPTVSLADLLRDDEGYPRGVRGWRLA